MTTTDLIQRVKARIARIPFHERPKVDFDIAILIPASLQELSRMVAGSSDKELLRKDYSIALSSGTASIAANLAASEPPLVDHFMGWTLYASDSTYPYQPLPDRPALLLDRPTGLGYFTLDGVTLRTKNASGSLTGLTETATLRANYLVSLANVPVQRERDLELIVVGMIAGEQKEAA